MLAWHVYGHAETKFKKFQRKQFQRRMKSNFEHIPVVEFLTQGEEK
jgi:hypothetical protein